MNKEEHVFIKIKDYIFYSWRWYLCGAEEQFQRVRTHEGVVGSRKNQWTTDFSQKSGTYIVDNSHVTGSNFSFSLVMVTPTSHFFVFHWLQFTSMCCLFPIGYFYGRTYLPPFAEFRTMLYSDNHFFDIIFGRMKLSKNIHRYNHTCRTWWHSGRSLNAKSIFVYIYAVLFRTIQFSISIVFIV